MTFDLTRWPEADALLDRALDLPPAERASFLQQHASHDPDLLRALHAVLAEAGRSDGFLEPGGALSGPLGAEVGRALDASSLPTAALQPGTVVEHYQIVELIGRGGMGEVYRARDPRLGRDVAIKVLPSKFSRDAQRIARFRREARVLAALSHPGIGAIYGVTEAAGVEALVLELVEGPTLADRLRQGPLPLVEALDIARQLAGALAAAHAIDILHRDLKPGNIKLAPGGRVKILDFGLGKALTLERHDTGPGADLTSMSPGVMLGTAAYMSPEQVRREAVDRRSDVWAFGCVLFEMLTGTRAFGGGTLPDVRRHVLDVDPAWERLPGTTPPRVRQLLRHALAKDPARRLGDIREALHDLDVSAAGSGRALDGARLPVAAALTAALGLLALLLWQTGAAPGAPAPAFPTSRLAVLIPDTDTPVTGVQPMAALSPDGRTLVYAARRDGVTRLFLRRLDQLDAQPLAGTPEAKAPFFSPDGRSVAFIGGGALATIDLESGSVAELAPAHDDATGTWTAGGDIVFGSFGSEGLHRVPAGGGGAPQPLTRLDRARDELAHLLPQALPDGRTLLFTIATAAGHDLAIADLGTGEHTLVTRGTHGRLTAENVLVFWRDGSLWAARFDAAARALSGTAVRVPESVEHTGDRVAHFDVTANGTMVYLPAGYGVPSRSRLVWMDRSGTERPLALGDHEYVAVDATADSARLALAIRAGNDTDLWVADPGDGTLTQLTSDPARDTLPIWSRDGQWIVFQSNRDDGGLFRRQDASDGRIEPVAPAPGALRGPHSWSADGGTLVAAVQDASGHSLVRIHPGERVEVLLESDAVLLDPRVSPDGRWLAYRSDETGRFEVYVRPMAALESRARRISPRGGHSPRWSPSGAELFYLDDEGMSVVPFGSAASTQGSPPRRLFEIESFDDERAGFVVGAGGREFLFIVPAERTARPSHLVVVQQWLEELHDRLVN